MKIYYGKETKRAIKNFPFSGPRVSFVLLHTIAEIKLAAARAWVDAGGMSRAKAKAIIQAAKEIIQGDFDNQFILPALQGGAGTSFHMNVNEVIASRATEILSKTRRTLTIHPIDDVNKGQSTNDVVPSALKIESVRATRKILTALEKLANALAQKGKEFKNIPKLGRTHLQDAVPIFLGDEFIAYAAMVQREAERIKLLLPFLYELNLGGTMVGNGLNAPRRFVESMYRELRVITGMPLVSARNRMAHTGAAQDFVALSQAFTTLTTDLSKMANDLRMLASGPHGGFGEIMIKEVQNGSSIMPGKVNPVQLETINQLHFLVIGNNLSITEAAHGAQLELSAITPLIAERLLSSAELIYEVIEKALIPCVRHIRANKRACQDHLERSMAYATVLVPHLGYDTVASLVKRATREHTTLRNVVIQEKLMKEKEFDALVGFSRRRPDFKK